MCTNLVPAARGAESGLDWNGCASSTETMEVDPPISARRRRFASLGALCGRLSMERRKLATVAAAALALAVAYHVVFGANGLTVYEQKRNESQLLSLQMLELQQENDLLTGRVNRLQSDPNAIEHQAREELRYTRPGEVIYALPSK
jgi:cell division protein FtsB